MIGKGKELFWTATRPKTTNEEDHCGAFLNIVLFKKKKKKKVEDEVIFTLNFFESDDF